MHIYLLKPVWQRSLHLIAVRANAVEGRQELPLHPLGRLDSDSHFPAYNFTLSARSTFQSSLHSEDDQNIATMMTPNQSLVVVKNTSYIYIFCQQRLVRQVFPHF